MPITRHHSGRWLYQFDRVIAGQRVRANKLLPEGTTRQKALEFDQRETRRLWELATGGEQPEPLIDDAVLVYLEAHAPSLKNKTDIEAALDILHPYYTGKRMSQLADVAEVYRKKAVGEDGKALQPATIKNRLAYLRAACRWAWKNKKMGKHDPAERMVLPKVDNKRHVYLTRKQAVQVFRRMGWSYSRDAARIAFYTGWRIGEVLAATPVETTSGLCLSLRPDQTKNGQPRVVPVHHRIAHLVRSHWPIAVSKWTVSKAIKDAYREVGLGHARLHDLRHSAASEMINAGVDLYTVGGVLGHLSTVSTARYAHLAAHRLKDAVSKIGAKISQPRPEAKRA